MWKDVLLKVLALALPMITKNLKDELNEYLDRLEAKAKETSNPVDDFFVMILKAVLTQG